MKIYVTTDRSSEFIQIKDFTTFDVNTNILEDKIQVQLLAFIQNNDPKVILEYTFDKNTNGYEGKEQDYLDDISEIAGMVELLCLGLRKAINYIKINRRPTSNHSYLITISDYMTSDGFFNTNYNIHTKKIK